MQTRNAKRTARLHTLYALLYHTPGVNDATSMAEAVIFDLMDEVDVVVLLRAQQTLTATVAAFLGQLVRHKDLDKFCFNINFADSQGPEQAEDMRAHVAAKLGELRNWPIRALRERVFLCSTRRTLGAALGVAGGDADAHLNEHHAQGPRVHPGGYGVVDRLRDGLHLRTTR